MLLYIPGKKRPFCVWENKTRSIPALDALRDAQFYVKHLHEKMPIQPALPRLAAGFNGQELLLSYFTPSQDWVAVKANGAVVKDELPTAPLLANGISAYGVLNSVGGYASAADLRALLPRLKTIYRNIPPLTTDQGRTPIDFTIALLTVRLLVEGRHDWGTWAEQPSLQTPDSPLEKRILERLKTLANRITKTDKTLAKRYGNILRFKEKEGGNEVAFNFDSVLNQIPSDRDHFKLIFDAIDSLPPLEHADFDIFGEVYQHIGDKATKKALGEFFTGRHIISGVLPVLFSRAAFDNAFASVSDKRIADIACGTGGFLTEFLRMVKRHFNPDGQELRTFATQAFFGYDLGPTNAQRARVNMYFAGDGFSAIEGGVDAISDDLIGMPPKGFDAILTNPPYGNSTYGRIEEAFLRRTIEVLKAGSGWGLLVLPTGVLENPRSDKERFNLLKHACLTDVIELPKHAFAPYTQQKTAIIIFRRRAKPVAVADGDWPALIKAIEAEEVSLFIVDNDGFANSDKRYPTDRRDASGRWLHNDLAEWIDNAGAIHKSALYDAAIGRIAPPAPHTNEFGEQEGRQYAPRRILELRKLDYTDVVLLPDAVLRRQSQPLTPEEFFNACKAISRFREPDFKVPSVGFVGEIKRILSAPLSYPDSVYTLEIKLEDMFTISKGNQGLTEEYIYKAFDLSGIKVYGGGASEPRFTIHKAAITKHGFDITIFEGPAIVISMDGTSGAMRVVTDAEFCLNHHGCVLKPHDTSLDLYWFIQEAEVRLRALASNQEGSATLTLDNLKNFIVRVPLPQHIRNEIGSHRREVSVTLEHFS